MRAASESFGCRIAAVDVESGVLYPFGSSGGYTCYLLFSGVHYDSLYCESAGGGRPITMFAVDDKAARDAALAAAAAARSSGAYTALSSFLLRCGQCGITVRGQQEARKHCSETKHSQFDEFKQ